jgi:hypothetical protein
VSFIIIIIIIIDDDNRYASSSPHFVPYALRSGATEHGLQCTQDSVVLSKRTT